MMNEWAAKDFRISNHCSPLKMESSHLRPSFAFGSFEAPIFHDSTSTLTLSHREWVPWSLVQPSLDDIKFQRVVKKRSLHEGRDYMYTSGTKLAGLVPGKPMTAAKVLLLSPTAMFYVLASTWEHKALLEKSEAWRAFPCLPLAGTAAPPLVRVLSMRYMSTARFKVLCDCVSERTVQCEHCQFKFGCCTMNAYCTSLPSLQNLVASSASTVEGTVGNTAHPVELANAALALLKAALAVA